MVRDRKEYLKEYCETHKSDKKQYDALYREKNREHIRKRDAKYNEKKREWYRDFKNKINICSFCGDEFPSCCIDFHHLSRFEGKEVKLSRLDSYTKRKEFVVEARKCVPLCSNCHRLVTYGIIDDNELNNEWFISELNELEAALC